MERDFWILLWLRVENEGLELGGLLQIDLSYLSTDLCAKNDVSCLGVAGYNALLWLCERLNVLNKAHIDEFH